MGTEAEHVVLNTYQPSDPNMVDIYFDLFENYMRPVRKLRVSRHQFCQQKQWPDEPIDMCSCHLKDILRECRLQAQIWDEMLLDQVIYGNCHEELVKKFLSKGEDLTIN